jgi:hypothetical protein
LNDLLSNEDTKNFENKMKETLCENKNKNILKFQFYNCDVPNSKNQHSKKSMNPNLWISLINLLENSPGNWTPFTDTFSQNSQVSGLLSFFTKMDFASLLKKNYNVYRNIPDQVLKQLTSNIKGYVFCKNTKFLDLLDDITNILNFPRSNQLLEILKIKLHQNMFNFKADPTAKLSKLDRLSNDLYNKIKEANSIREDINKMSLFKILKLIKSNSKKTNSILSNQDDRSAPVQKYYSKMNKMVKNSDENSFSPLTETQKKRGAIQQRLKEKKLKWNSIFDKAHSRNIINLEKKTFFNNKKLNGFKLANEKSEVGKEISNFMNKRRNSMLQYGLKKPSMYNFSRRNSPMRRRSNRNPFNRMHKMMRSSMFDINFK